jgi:hypothetical protein
MHFKNASTIESVCWYMRLTDQPRATNRALIDRLFNGFAPFSDKEQQENRINTNVNFLDSTRLAHDMRRQFSNAFLRPGDAFKVEVDYGPVHRRQEISQKITQKINKQIKHGNSALRYRECLRNVFAQVTLHGIGPRAWDGKESWCPSMQMMGDVLVPSGTFLTMENLGHFAIQRRYTAGELYRMTHGPRVDSGWKMPVVKKCLEWARKQMATGVGQGQIDDFLLSPERTQEAFKADLGFFTADRSPVIQAWDFYFLDDSSKNFGWKRRMVLDSPDPKTGQNFLGTKNEFLYDGGNRNYASKLGEIIHFQYADGNVVAPFQYHSVRSLGFLLYSVCHLQNRLRCKFNDSVFESLLNYFRVANPDDAERLQKIDLINLGIIPDGMQFVTRNERWQIDPALIQQAMVLNRQTMADNSTSFTSDFGFQEGQPEKSATQITAEVSASTSLTSSMLQEAYGYEEFAQYEIARRFCKPNSRDVDVREFRKSCLTDGVPEEALNVERWRINADRVIGAGNKQLELGMVQQLMEIYPLLEPESQRMVLRLKVFSATDDAALTNQIVPEQPQSINRSIHDAQLSAGVMLKGLPMTFMQGGINHGEYASTLLGMAKTEIDKINALGGMTDAETIAGLQNLIGQTIDGQPIPGNGAVPHIEVYSQDEETKPTVKVLMDIVGNLMNDVRAFQQRLQEQMEAAAQPGANGAAPAMTPEDAVKLRSQLELSRVKSESMAEAHAQRSQQRAEIHQQKMVEAQQRSQLENAKTIRQTQVDEAATDLRTVSEIERQNAKAAAEPASKSE